MDEDQKKPNTQPILDAVENADKKLKELLSKSETTINNLSRVLVDNTKKAFDSLYAIGNRSIEEFKKVNDIVLKNDDLIKGITKSYITFREITKTQDLFSGLNNSTATFGQITDQIAAMGSEWGKLTGFLETGFGSFGKAGVQIFENLKNNAAYGQKAESQMISMLAASGELGKMFDNEGNIIGDLNTKTLKYTNSLGSAAEASGMTLNATIKFADALNRIPGFMDENINMGEALGGEMSALTAAMKIMSGSGQNIAEVEKVLTNAYQNLGNASGQVVDKGQKGLMLLSTMSTLSKDLNLTFNETSGYLEDVAKGFKFVGDNTEAAAKTLGRYMEALRNTGLTSSASLDIIKGMNKAIGDLNVGTKAFISARGGGPGGLQGALQIEQLMRQGKSDQVMTMVMDSLKKQFGGRIVSQAEGAQSQEMAAQFFRQREMLKSGAFGGLVGTGPEADEKATRLLEALASGNMGAAVKTSQQALEAVGKQGNSLQGETNTILNKVALSSERTAIATQLSALKDVRGVLGSGNANIGIAMKQDMKESGARSANIDERNLKIGVAAENYDAIFMDVAKKGYQELASGLQLAFEGGKGLIDKAKTGLSEGHKFMQQFEATKKNIDNQKRIQAETVQIAKPTLTVAANPEIQRRAVQNATRNNAIQMHKIEATHTVRVEMANGADKLLKVLDVKTETNNRGGDNKTSIADINGSKEPGQR